ncbi:hypothetical protein JTB14_021736 [Gonioctena quinquepunctata]|nr:hypothetical protein JTB14_021736 [Gonioctena quinquepunctata]
MKKLTKIAKGIELHKSNIVKFEVCQDSNQARKPSKNERTRATRPLEIVHTDLIEVETPTYDKKKYAITCLDDFTHYTQVYLLEHKSEAAKFLKDSVAEIESNILKNWCSEGGIELDYNIPHTPMVNGSAERHTRTLMEELFYSIPS